VQPFRKFPPILRNPKVHHRVHKSPALVPILNLFDPVHTIPSLKSIIQIISPCPRLLVSFRNKIIFYGEELLAPTPNPHAVGPLIVGRPRLLIEYIRSYPPYLEAVSSIRIMRTRHALVTRNPPNMELDGTWTLISFGGHLTPGSKSFT
jgi:hypothetical protein